MFGTDEARKVWKERVKNLKNLYHETIIRGYKHFVDMALAELITDQSQLKSTWDEIIEEIKGWCRFDNWFITLKDYDITNGHNGLVGSRGKYWYEDDHVSKLSDRYVFSSMRLAEKKNDPKSELSPKNETGPKNDTKSDNE